MSEKKPVTLMGRLAVQLQMISMGQLAEATAEQGRHPDKRLGDILLELGLVDPQQMERLKNVQRDVIAKHRAKQALAADQTAAPTAPPRSAAKPAPPKGAAIRIGVMRPPPAAAPAPQPASPATPALTSAPPATAPVEAKPEMERAPAKLTAPTEVGESLALQLPTSLAADRERLHEVLRNAVQVGASDVHIHSGAPIRLRVNGAMAESGAAALDADEAGRIALAALDQQQTALLGRHGEIDLCYAVEGVGRFRSNVYRQQRGFDAVFRSIPPEPPTLEELKLPNVLAKFTNYHQGMVLVTGPAGCGKSSTMAALVNLINEEREEHILTIEDPIEYLHRSKRCLVNQRHAGQHTTSFARALRAALREDPDVIVIGELRDLETISLAMTAAETGHFVLATLHTNNAVRTINRMIGAFPFNQQDQVRTMLSESLRAVISQRLVATADGGSRIPALEILVINKAIGNLIRDQKTVQIRSAIQTGKSQGMCLLEQSLDGLVRSGTISRDEALRYAEEKKLISG